MRWALLATLLTVAVLFVGAPTAAASSMDEAVPPEASTSLVGDPLAAPMSPDWMPHY